MNLAYLDALAALAGSVIGGRASVASAWLVQKRHDRAKRPSRDKASRQKLYKQFIDEASNLYADALMHEEAEVSAVFRVLSAFGAKHNSLYVRSIEEAPHLVFLPRKLTEPF